MIHEIAYSFKNEKKTFIFQKLYTIYEMYYQNK